MNLWVINVYTDQGASRLLYKSKAAFDTALASSCIGSNHRELFDVTDDFGVRIIVAIGKLDRIFASEINESAEADATIKLILTSIAEAIQKRVETRLKLIEGGKSAS